MSKFKKRALATYCATAPHETCHAQHAGVQAYACATAAECVKRRADPAPSRARVDAASERHDDPRIPAVLEHIRGGTPIKNAFALEGIPKRTAYAWMEASEQLKDDVDMARAVASEARRKLFEADPSSPLLHYIQTLDPENFPTPAQRVEASGPGGGPQEVKHSGTVEIDVTSAVRIARQAKESK